MTHPFHPRLGEEFVIEDLRFVWGEERVYFVDENGDLIGLPARWTSIGAVDPFLAVSAGRCFFRVSDLLRLAELTARLEEEAGDPSPA